VTRPRHGFRLPGRLVVVVPVVVDLSPVLGHSRRVPTGEGSPASDGAALHAIGWMAPGGGWRCSGGAGQDVHFQGHHCPLRGWGLAKVSACLQGNYNDACGRRSPLEVSFLSLLLSPLRLIFLAILVCSVLLFPRSFQSHACRRFVVVRLGGGVAGRFFVLCRQHVDPCFHRSSALLVGWEDGSHSLLVASGCQHFILASVASVPTFRSLRVLLDVQVVGSGDVGELLPPPGSCGRSWPPFLQKLFIVAIKSCFFVLPSADSF
jgi:hypothetical protein